MCTAAIREKISNIDIDVLFSTREFLSYGKRAAVDEALYRMVKNGDITRVAPAFS